MIDTQLRYALRQDMRDLISGRLDGAEFEDAFLFRYAQTDDQGVREIANIGRNLAAAPRESASSIHPLARPANRAILERSILFLQSGRDYEWPDDSINPGRQFIAGMTLLLILPVLMAVALFYLPESLGFSPDTTIPLALVGVIGMLGALWLICYQPSRSARQVSQQKLPGDPEVWPFCSWNDLNLAARQCRLAASLNTQRI